MLFTTNDTIVSKVPFTLQPSVTKHCLRGIVFLPTLRHRHLICPMKRIPLISAMLFILSQSQLANMETIVNVGIEERGKKLTAFWSYQVLISVHFLQESF